MTVLAVAAMFAVSATSYCQTGTMADGSYTRPGSVAMNTLPLGARIWVRPRVFGRHRYTVRDHIGCCSELDIWSPSCAASRAFGRRVVRVVRGWGRGPERGRE